MNALLVSLHNIIRWVVIVLGVLAAVRGFIGWFGNKTWTDKDRKFGLFFTISFDIQIMIGILLYLVFSQWGIKSILNIGMSEVMGLSKYRFYVVEHGLMMFLGFILAHLGSILPKKVDDSRSKFKRTAILFGLAAILVIMGVPWDRPLLPGL